MNRYILKATVTGWEMKSALLPAQDAAVVEALAHILDSPSFRGSRRCAKFLEYSVQKVLHGEHDDLKERNIGIEVLHRTPDYDTSEDASVRVTANEVRKRLAQYYQQPGAHTHPVISLPPGSYAAAFDWPDAAVEPPPPAPPPLTAPAPRRWLWMAAVAAALALQALILGLQLWRGSAARATAPPSKADPLWSAVFTPARKTNIVISDAAFREIQQVVGRDISLSEYLSPGYPAALLPQASPETRQLLAFLQRQQTTSVGSATVATKLIEFGHRMGGNAVMRYPRHINAREFETDNFILLGSRLSIPWVELFEPALNFPLQTDPATHQFYLGNRDPHPAEQAAYRETADHGRTYADIALLPNVRGGGTVLILNGIDMTAAEAAGEFAMNGSLSSALSGQPGAAVEVLVEVRAIGGAASNARVVAVRKIDLARLR